MGSDAAGVSIGEQTTSADRVRAVLEVVLGVTPDEYERLRGGLPVDAGECSAPGDG